MNMTSLKFIPVHYKSYLISKLDFTEKNVK